MENYGRGEKRQKLSFEILVKFWGKQSTKEKFQDASTSTILNFMAGKAATNNTTVLNPAHVTSPSDETLPHSDWLGGQVQEQEDQWGGGIRD